MPRSTVIRKPDGSVASDRPLPDHLMVYVKPDHDLCDRSLWPVNKRQQYLERGGATCILSKEITPRGCLVCMQEK